MYRDMEGKNIGGREKVTRSDRGRKGVRERGGKKRMRYTETWKLRERATECNSEVSKESESSRAKVQERQRKRKQRQTRREKKNDEINIETGREKE